MASKGEQARNEILRFLRATQGEVRFADIAERLRGRVTEKTVQRRLADLVAQGLVMRTGEPRRYAYSAPVPEVSSASLDQFRTASIDDVVPLSDAAHAILAHLRLPGEQRTPVGYRRDFLDAYVPNETPYLPEAIRKHLNAIGMIPDEPGETFGNTVLADIHQRLLIDLSWASSRLEGNTYSLLDTQRLLELDEMAEGKDAVEATMILNHRDAIRFLIENRTRLAIDRHTLLNLHATLSRDLMPDPADEGRLRRKLVQIGQSVYVPPSFPQVIEEVFRQIVEKARAIDDPIEQSFFLLVHLPYLQPFTDVNKRTSRLAANIPLMKAGIAPLSFLDVPERLYIRGVLGVYELTAIDLLRDVFVWTYERSCAHYVARRQELRVTNRKRLAYRDALTRATRDVVQRKTSADEATILALAGRDIPENDVADFVRFVRENLARLREETIARYGIGLAEYHAWKSSQPPRR